jgi:hypothetical protein
MTVQQPGRCYDSCGAVCRRPLLFPHSHRQPIGEELVSLVDAPSLVLDVSGARPIAAIARLREVLPSDPAGRAEWLCQARVAAVMGSCPKSHDAFKSGMAGPFSHGIACSSRLFCWRPEALVRVFISGFW